MRRKAALCKLFPDLPSEGLPTDRDYSESQRKYLVSKFIAKAVHNKINSYSYRV